MVNLTIRARRAAIALAIAGLACVNPAEPRAAKLGAYQLDLRFVEEQSLTDAGRANAVIDGHLVGILVIRERGGSTGDSLPVAAEFAVISCTGMFLCGSELHFVSDSTSSIDAPVASRASLRLSLAGSGGSYIDLTGTFDGGLYSGKADWHRGTACCFGIPDASFNSGTFKARR